MFPAQRGLYTHKSTINQLTRPAYSFMNFCPFPFTNADLIDVSAKSKSRLAQYPSSGDEGRELSKDNINDLSMKKPISKAERRAEHNAIERARRETLNTKFQSLSQALPNLMNYRRPSKSQIVEKALDWVKQSLSREEHYRNQILELQRENKRLLAQCIQHEHIPPPPPVNRRMTQLPDMNLDPAPTPTHPPFLYPSTSSSSTAHSSMYTDFTTKSNSGWSNSAHLLSITPKMTPCTSTEDLSKQDFGEEDDKASNANEDDIDYSPYQVPISCLENRTPQQQQNCQAFMAGELYPVDYQTQDTQFNAHFAHHWNTSRYLINNKSSIDPEFSAEATPYRMVS